MKAENPKDEEIIPAELIERINKALAEYEKLKKTNKK
jgi:hypothetical protein